MKKVYTVIFQVIFLLLAVDLYAVDLSLSASDLAAERGDENGLNPSGKGIHLFIRKKPDIKSVLLVQSLKDPLGEEDNYAYRALEWNQFNGDELRLLNGKLLQSEGAKYSLISSTVVNHPVLGECFEIYIPPVIQYGYSWTENGTVTVGKGTFINIRTFERKYADYKGEFKDNPFTFDFSIPEKNELPPTQDKAPEKQEEEKSAPEKIEASSGYSTAAAQKFSEIADRGNGLLTFSGGPETLPDDLIRLLENVEDKKKVDIVFAIDTTGSMKDDLEKLKNEWVPRLMEQAQEFGRLRLGLLLYRDYTDNYLYRNLPVKWFDFTDDVDAFYKNLKSVYIEGNEGGDEPEAVYEALYAGLNFYEWDEEAVKKIILIGDAEPHARPRGTAKKITQEMVTTQAEEDNITLDCIIVPNKI